MSEINPKAFRSEVDETMRDQLAFNPDQIFEAIKESDKKNVRSNSLAQKAYKALALTARKQLAHRWVQTQKEDREKKARRVYYMSMEFLIGRTLNNALSVLGLRDAAEAAFAKESETGKLSSLIECEPDAGLGNGGLGRLAACFLDSMATVELPSWGYGMRYEYGMFAQSIVNGAQMERPDSWLVDGTPWEVARAGTKYEVSFGGSAEHHGDWDEWIPAEKVDARAFDYIIPGYATKRVSTLRLWKATAPSNIDLGAFNTGDYARAAEFKNRFENISWVLYPNDSTDAGRQLRLRQEYFFVSASMQDILHHHLEEHPSLKNLADHVAIHLNDTHPAISVAELMRLLCDVHGMLWKDAWAQCRRIFSYTNHTLMPEALETWPVGLMRYLLPRHMRIIYQINEEFLKEVSALFPGDMNLIRSVSLIDDADGNEDNKRVRMANLSIVASHRVNGVSALHSDLMVETIFAGFAKIDAKRREIAKASGKEIPPLFHNKTNGITPRRWLAQANPKLATLLDKRLGDTWRTHLERLAEIKPLAEDKDFRTQFAEIKHQNKVRLAQYIEKNLGIIVDPTSLFDIQVKRIHEYKRQLLNVLHVITRYNELLHGHLDDAPARTVIFAGKAASSYAMAKQIIRLIHDVANTVNNDRRIKDKLKVVFLPNYSVSLAEIIMPAADLSEQISTAGTEASGTGNMKFSLNGALTIGTEDGANIEIRDNVGAENIFIFGNTTPQVAKIREAGYDPRAIYNSNAMLKETLDKIDAGFFNKDDPRRYHDIFNALLNYGDHYLLFADYADYIATQLRVDKLYKNQEEWMKKSIINVAGMGFFSSDRTIREYAIDTWHLEDAVKA